MRKALIAALTIVSLTCAHAQAETATPKKKPVVSKKSTVSKTGSSKVAARKSNIKRASIQRDHIVGNENTLDAASLGLHSSSVLVLDQVSGSILY
jgi:hypothetical protein